MNCHDAKKGVSLSMKSWRTVIGSKKQNKPFTLGPEVEKLIIPGIGLICAPLSLSIT